MENLLTKDELYIISEKKSKGPRWFLLTYDAGAEIQKEKMNENKQKVPYKIRKFIDDDFRKVIIRSLRKAKVEVMYQMVETGVLFLDPRTNIRIEDKLGFWETEFDSYEKDFYYGLAAVLQEEDGDPYYRARENQGLVKSFAKLVAQILVEEEQ